jgi:hypothetical protein
MSTFELPDTVNYQEQLSQLPKNTQCINIASAPSNLQTAVSGNQIFFDIVNRGFLDPQSIYLSYTYTCASCLSAEIIGTPVYQPFNRLEVSIGSVTVDQIQNYNLVMNCLVNNNFDIAQKYGQQASYGYNALTGVPTLEQLDGHIVNTANETATLTAPLFSIFSSAEKLIPTFAMGNIRMTLTVDSLNNIFSSTNFPSAGSFTLSNLRLRYKIVDFGSDVENSIRMANPNGLTIKTQSFSSASTTLAANSSGYQELIFNMRYSSIKALIANNGGGSVNKQFDSVDLTRSNGEYSFSCNGVLYPQTALSTKTNKTEILQELRSAWGSIVDKNNNCSINMIEYGYIGTSGAASTTTFSAPSKFWVGTSLEKMVNSGSLLSGVSSAESPISYRINLGESIGTNNSTVTLIVNYDALIIVDPNTKQTVIKE